MDALEQRLLDANRTIGQPNKLTLIFGRRITRHHSGTLQTVIEDLNLANPVIRSHYRKAAIWTCSKIFWKLSWIDSSFTNSPSPTLLPNGRRIPGLKLDQPRPLAPVRALVPFCHLAAGGTFRLLAHGYQICLVFVKLYERIYAPLTAGILQPFAADDCIPDEKMNALDRRYTAVVHALDALVQAIGLKAA